MALFQISVLNKYLREIDDKRIAELYSTYSTYFLNLEIQQNIRDSKEEQFQEGFLRELFVNVLGYVINPNPNYNLTTELKNETGAKKADGAILVNGKAIGVIELKSTSTKDLESIRQQAFDYKANQSECVYVVTSNFEKLRFYIDNAVDYEEFDLFTLSQQQFKLLYLCLNVDSIMAGIPKTAKTASLVKEENVTKKLYADYSVFKEKLFNDIISKDENIIVATRELAPLQNEQTDKGTSSLIVNNEKEAKLILFKKTQKLMDRFLFIFFAEDRGLIPPNTISTILSEWEQLKSLDAYRPLYDRFKRHFDYINAGWKGDNYEIFAYNGGLFLPDEILDNITISDEVLYKYTTILTKYDFDSEVDVNILGHIFEHSLNEIETMNAELEGQQIDLKKSKRKKDGVFYTPKYITKYIVDNTIGKLCEEKKEELSIVEDDYLRGKKGRKKDTIKQLETKLTDYRDWLLKITVVDPACGSGAFLNQALEFLIREHKWIDEMTAKLFGGGLVFQDVENSILENNLYGVDINEESVEIAKLSLWLRTAQKGRKLTSLNNNIKCGNSLIDDPEVAGDKAFKWEEEFPKVFAKGGFDVVIGNPPYGAKLDVNIQKWLANRYIKGGSETAISFIKLGYEILREYGRISYIIPKSFSFSSNYKSIREFLLSDLDEVIDCKKVWNEVKLEQVIFSCSKSIPIPYYNSLIRRNENFVEVGEIDKSTFKQFGFLLNGISDNELSIGNKLISNNVFLNDIATNSRGGIFQKHLKESGDYSVLGGAEIQRNGIVGIKGFVDRKIIENEPKAKINDNSVLVQNIVAHIENPTDHIKITACLPDKKEIVIVDTINQITPIDLKISAFYIWALLNSKIINWFVYRFIFGKAIRTMHFDSPVTSRVPIPKINNNISMDIVKISEKYLRFYKDIEEKTSNFLSLLQSKYEIDKLSTKLQNWYELDFKQFIAELKKKKVVLSLSEEAEWMSYFNEKKAEAKELKSKIDATDNEIDLLVYKLYDLTYDEVLIVDPETKIRREVYDGKR